MYKWSKSEIESLEAAMRQYDEFNPPAWKDVAAMVGSRNARQCYDKWVLLLKKREEPVQRHIWTAIEERLLEGGIKEFGDDWEAIRERMLPGLSICQLKSKVRQSRGVRK